MRAAVDAVAGMIAAAGLTGVFTAVPSAVACAEPVVVRFAGFERESRQDGEERGVARVEVLVVRERDADAMEAAFACEAAVRSSGRAKWNVERLGVRIVGIDTMAPAFRMRDASGRYVWGFTALLTVAREI